MKIELIDATIGYGRQSLYERISLTMVPGEIVCLLGPNGTGKSTLIKTLLGLLPLQGGQLLYHGKPSRLWSRKEVARLIGYIPQSHFPPFSYRVFDVVLMGRTAHLPGMGSPKEKDQELAWAALELLDIQDLAAKSYTEISGGERQLVLLARAIAQQPQFLIMDEPTASLDFGNKTKVLVQLKKLSERGLGILMSTHEPDQAFQYADRVALLSQTQGLRSGSPNQLLTEEQLHDIYDIPIQVVATQGWDGREVKVCVPHLTV